MTAEITLPSSETTKPQKVLLGGITAMAQSAWMGFALASDVLEQLRMAPTGILRRIQVIRPAIPRNISLKNLLTREYSVGEASFILMTSFFLSALLGAVRQILFNAQFGVGPEANAYYAAFRLPDTLFSLVAGGALSSAMIPVLLGTSREEGERAESRLTSLVLTALLAAFALIVFVGEIFTPAFVNGVLAPGFDERTSDLAENLTRIMLLQPVVLAVGSVATAVLQVLILLPGLRARGFRYRPAWSPRDRRLREVVRLLVPNGLAVGVGYAGFIVDTAFASTAPEEAALPAIFNAWLLVGLPIALLGQAIGQAAFPRLAAHAAELNWAE